VHEFDTDLEVGEEDALENSDFWQGSDLDDGVSDDAKVALCTHDNVVEVRSVGGARPERSLLVSTLGLDEGDVLNDILDVAVSVLLHSTCARCNPTAESREFRRVGLVAAANTVLLEVTLQLLSLNTCLHASHVVFLVDPQNRCHAAHIN